MARRRGQKYLFDIWKTFSKYIKLDFGYVKLVLHITLVLHGYM